MKKNKNLKWRKFEEKIILCAVRWYGRYGLRYQDLREIMLGHGLSVHHTTLCRWVQVYAPEINRRSRNYIKMTGTS